MGSGRSSLTCGAAASLRGRGRGIAGGQWLRSNTNTRPPLGMPKPGMEMAVRRRLGEKKNTNHEVVSSWERPA